MRKTNKPIIREGLLLTEDVGAGGCKAIHVGSPLWHTWLAGNPSFIFEDRVGHFTARREMRRGSPYWYAYRRRGGKLFKAYLGKSEELTPECLEQASARLAGQTTRTQLVGQSDSADWMAALESASVPQEGAEAGMSLLPLTKVRPPALPFKLIERSRLTQRISAPVTFLCAPAGFGKSTLLNEWRQTCGMPVAWVALDADDNHPSRFWSTVVAALQTVHPDLGRDLLLHLQASLTLAVSEIIVRLANDIVRVTDASEALPRMGLILDDYHNIQHPDIHAAIQTLLEHLPPTLCLVISSRTRPPLALGHLRAQGKVAELQTGDLRFTLEEGIGFIGQHTPGRRLAYADMLALVKRAEGWAAGLTLATLALTQPGDLHQFMATFTGAHPYLREYFMENVLDRQPPSVRTFLLKTAILKYLTGRLCDAVTGQTDGTEMLSHLWQRNLFLAQLEEQDWYRYHSLFAQMLSSQLQTQCPDEIPRLHRKAAEWYRTHNAPADAVNHLLAIEAWEEAASLIESMALRELAERGEESRLLRWLQQLPEVVVQRHRTLLFTYMRLAAMALSDGEAKRFLAHTEASITRIPTRKQTRDEKEVRIEIQQIRRLLAADDSATPQWPTAQELGGEWQRLNGLLKVHCVARHGLAQVDTMAREVYEIALAQRNLYVMLNAAALRAFGAFMQGNLQRSEKTAEQVLQQALAQCTTLPDTAGMLLTLLGEICYARNQLAQAQQLLVRADEVDPMPVGSNRPIETAIVQAKIQSAQGDVEAAWATLQAAWVLQARRPSNLWPDRDLIAYQAWLCVHQGDIAGAECALSESGDSDTHALSALVRAEILLAQKRGAEAQDLLDRLIANYPQGLAREPILVARIMLALALFQQHRVNQARRVIVEAVRIAAPESFIRPFLDHGVTSVPLLTLVLHTKDLTAETRSFVRQVLRLLGHDEGAPGPLLKAKLMALSAAAFLSAREQQVLQLVSSGLSDQELAARLSISANTVKTHLKNIYRKLGVKSRTQAVAQAQAFKLV